MWEVKGRHGKRCIERCQLSQPSVVRKKIVVWDQTTEGIPPNDNLLQESSQRSSNVWWCCQEQSQMKLAIFDTFSMYVFSGGSSENYFTPTPKRWRSSLKVPHPKRFEENSWICFFHRSHPCCQARSRRRGVGGKAGQISWRSSETWGNPDPQNAEKFRCLGFLFGQFAQNDGSVGVLLKCF